MSNRNLKLFQSQPAVTGGTKNTSFSTTPTEITEADAFEFFRNDHTPIQFKDGHCKGENFEYATCVVFDIDNRHSDDPADWVYPDTVSHLFQKQSINHWTAATQNHLLSMNGKAARPMFHVYLPLVTPIYDIEIYLRVLAACVRPFEDAVLKIKFNAHKALGFSDNPNAFVECWLEGLCFDETVRAPFCLPQDDTVSNWSPEAERKIISILESEQLVGELLSQYIDDVYHSKSTRNALEKVKRRVVFDFKDRSGGKWSFTDEVVQSTAATSKKAKRQSILVPILMGRGCNVESVQSVTLSLTPKMSGNLVILEIEEAEPLKRAKDRRIKKSSSAQKKMKR